MSSIIDSLSSLISSILDIFKSIFMTIYHSLGSVLSIFTDSISSIANLGGDFASFIMRNFVVIGLLVAAFVGYSAYQQKQGRTASGKKRM